jgi:hypothetical protein
MQRYSAADDSFKAVILQATGPYIKSFYKYVFPFEEMRYSAYELFKSIDKIDIIL